MKHTRTSIAIMAALLAPTAALADTPAWNIVEAGYAQVDVDDLDSNLSGFNVRGSFLIGDNVIVSALHTSVSDEIDGVDVDLSQTSAGLGYRYGLTNSTDVYGLVTYESADAEFSYQGNSIEGDGNGFGLTLGLRSRITANLELDGNIGYIDLEDEDETTVNVGAYYYFTQHFAIGVNYRTIDDLSIAGAGLRYAF